MLIRRVRKNAKETISFIKPARPVNWLSLFMEQFGSHWKDVDEILYIFSKSVVKIQV
jgi:hypothetical protein